MKETIIYKNENGLEIIARNCFECQVPMIPAHKSQASDLCKWCYVKVWGENSLEEHWKNYATGNSFPAW